ncbi:DUF2911 domain-containing protein [Portibacter marinus]|uniref:DUF2911 domain-containing protein n=1 Tax=Portibacter marinus TaxID=2898660 RepID=UPI001F28E015|nr:DUF2911 domain-containing protein [Portibacter marinus]
MRSIGTIVSLLIVLTTAYAQDSKWPSLDASTMDAEYYPAEVAWRNYLSEDKRNITPKMKVVYSRPMMKDRKIFGNLVPYGEEWRLGANEATMITFYQPVDFGGQTVNQGTYSLFVVPEAGQWTFHLSSEMGIWGSANRDKSKTVASATVKTEDVEEPREALAMAFQEVDDLTANLIVEWEKTRAVLPIAFNPVILQGIDASPMDMAHYPRNSAFNNYAESEDKKADPIIQVIYSRPQKNDRDIFGGLLKEGEVWRIGANEATEVVFYKDVKIGEKELRRGRYAMFAELNGDTWDVIFSKDYPIWGAANRDESKDVASVTVPVYQEDEVVEALAIIFEEKSETSADMIIGWDKTRATVPVSWEK